MFSDFVEETLRLLGCQFIWLLALQEQELITLGIASNKNGEANRKFQQTLRQYYVNESFHLQLNDNPLAEVLLRDTPFYNITTSYLDKVPGGIPLVLALEQLDIDFVSFLPLVNTGTPLGVLVLGADNIQTLDKDNQNTKLDRVNQQARDTLKVYLLEQKIIRLEDQYQRLNVFQQAVFENLKAGAVLIDEHHQIKQINDKFLAISGGSPAYYYGQDVTSLFTLASKQKAIQVINNYDNSLPSRQRIVLANGGVLPVLMEVRAIWANSNEDIPELLLLFEPTNETIESSIITPEAESQRLKVLTRASQALSSDLPLPEVIEMILTSSIEVVNGVVAAILLVDIDNPDELIFVSLVGPYAEEMQGRRVPIGMGITGWVAAEGRAQLVASANHDPRFQVALDAHEALDVQSIAAIPLKTSETVIGVLEIVNKETGSFDQYDLEILESLSSTAAVAIQNANLYDQTHRRLTELSTLLEASAAVTSTLELQDILGHITRRLLSALDVQRVVVTSSENNDETLSVLAEMVDAEWRMSSAPSISLNDAPIKLLTVERRLLTIGSLMKSELTYTEKRELEVRGMGAVLNVPMRRRDGGVIGIISLYHRDARIQFDTIQQTAVMDVVQSWAERDKDQLWVDLDQLCHRAMRATSIDWCAVYRWVPHEDSVYLMREIGNSFTEDGKGALWGLHQYPLMQHVISSSESQLVWTDDIAHDFKEKDYLTHVGAGSCLMVPLIIRGKSSGIVKLMSIDRRLFDSGELSLCMGIANAVGNALENASLYLSLEQRALAVEAAYRDLEAADQLKDNLLQNLSHEISTPLMHILGYVNLLQEGEFGPLTPEQLDPLNQVAKKSDHIAEIVRDMVAAYATRSGQLDLKRVKLQKIAALAMRSLAGKASAADIKIFAKVDESTPRVFVDPGLMGQVFEALLDNAIKFSNAGQTVEISIKDTHGPMIEICVRDSGIGIPKEEQDKVFMRFYQVHSGTTRRFEGTGLGLSIVYDVVASHGGKIWIESEEGHGTAVFFTVPKANLSQTGPLTLDDDFAIA